MVVPDEPEWLAAWRGGRLDAGAALARFDALDGLPLDAMLGRWHGMSLPTGHPLDGVLEGLGWWGKAFEAPDRAHPLLFRTSSGVILPIDPPRLLVGLGLRVPALGHSSVVRGAFRATLPLLRTHRPAARRERRSFRGKVGTAMVYNRLPITDHFRRIDDDHVLGLMVLRVSAPPYFFFLLNRERREVQPNA